MLWFCDCSTLTSIMKIYLAGPDIFRPDSESWASAARDLCRQYGFEALTPLDHGETGPRQICEANLELIRKAQMVVANLNPFRGAEPYSGTVFELGYGMALGKKPGATLPAARHSSSASPVSTVRP